MSESCCASFYEGNNFVSRKGGILSATFTWEFSSQREPDVKGNGLWKKRKKNLFKKAILIKVYSTCERKMSRQNVSSTRDVWTQSPEWLFSPKYYPEFLFLLLPLSSVFVQFPWAPSMLMPLYGDDINLASYSLRELDPLFGICIELHHTSRFWKC